MIFEAVTTQISKSTSSNYNPNLKIDIKQLKPNIKIDIKQLQPKF